MRRRAFLASLSALAGLASEAHAFSVNLLPILEAAQLQPVPPPGYFVTLTQPLTAFGDSLTAGNFAGAGFRFEDYAQPYVSLPIDNQGIGGQTSTQIADRVVAATASQLASHVWLEMGRNDFSSVIGTSGIVAGVLSNYSRSVAVVTGDYLTIGPPAANIEPYGDPTWAQCHGVLRGLCAAYPNAATNWNTLLRTHPTHSAGDQVALNNGYTLQSARLQTTGVVNSLHPGPRGNQIIAYDQVVPYLRGREGSVYALPGQERHIIAASAQSMGGAITTLPIIGTPDSVALVGGNIANMAVNSSGQVTNATGVALAGLYYVVFAVTKDGYTSTGDIHLFIGSSTTACADTALDGRAFMVQPDSPTGIDSQYISGAVAFSTADLTDGVSMFLLGNENFGRVTIERNVSNRIRIICKDNSAAPGTSIVVLQSLPSGSGLITHGSGLVWVFFNADINAATPTSNLFINETSSKSLPVLTQGSTINWSNRAVIAAQSQAGANPFKGALRAFWLVNAKVDFGVAGNRSQLYDPITKAAVALPADGGITPVSGSYTKPLIWLPGNDGDRALGFNGGTSGDFVTAMLPGTSLRNGDSAWA